jgi:hypothetical protein
MDTKRSNCNGVVMLSILKSVLVVLVFACAVPAAAAELYALQQLVGPVRPGRYWLDAYGNAGFEGGPPLVNLAQARARGAQGYAGWNNNTAFGNWGGDGECSYYNSPSGDSVMVGNC